LALSPFELPSKDSPDAPFVLEQDGQHLIIPLKVLFSLYHAAQETLKRPALAIDVDEASRIVLLQSPEHLTAINARRRLVMQAGVEQISLCHQELHFLELLFTMRPQSKSLPLWGYRRWLLKLLGWLPELLQAELKLARQACSFYLRNYGAYSHRAILARDSTLEEDEMNSLQAHLDSHPGDHSAACLHAQLLQRQPSRAQEHAKQIMERLQRYPHYETPWLHFRALFCPPLLLSQSLLEGFIQLQERLQLDARSDAEEPDERTLAGQEAKQRRKAVAYSKATEAWLKRRGIFRS
jgi:hypothetical protein